MAEIKLGKRQIARVKRVAALVAGRVLRELCGYSTMSVERSVLRLFGVDGLSRDGMPLPNVVVDLLMKRGVLTDGAAGVFARAMIVSGKDPQKTAELLAAGKIKVESLEGLKEKDVSGIEKELTRLAIETLDLSRKRKEEKARLYSDPPRPWKYMIVATGNIHEDVKQAESAVFCGADIIAVIRSTAQSLLDYVPYGITTEGFGGTYATQANFRVMRNSLDKYSKERKRYVRLVNYSSGLCMAEIAVCAAFEDLDILLNDSMYGILFRDINMGRTFIDQHFSRLLCGRAGIMINTGEDNYLTTSDAIEKAHTVTASQLINEAMAKLAALPEELLGLGHAFEIDPQIENGFLYELAHAQLARQLFPDSPIKYMPPTKHKSRDIFFSHALDTMFNLASVTTNQGIHLAGILTEALHTPLTQDRYISMASINYVFHTARDLGGEIEFRKGGFIEKRAQAVLDEAESFLNEVKERGLFKAIEAGMFAEVKRPIDGGKGVSGVFKKGRDYSNPVMDALNEKPDF